MQQNDRYWLAGWLEGEGSFGRYRIQAQTTDEWAAQRAADITGGTVYGPMTRPTAPNSKPFWQFYVGRQKRVAKLLGSLQPLMSPRRQEQIDEALS